MNKILNIKYLLGQVFYFATISATMGFASVFLLHHKFSNSVIGITLSICSIISVILQPTVASFADKHKEISINTIMKVMLLIAIVLSLVLYIVPLEGVLFLAVVVAIFAICTSLQPLMNSMAFIFEKYGIKIDFGIARGIGSAAYAVTSMVMGYVVEMFNPAILPLTFVLFNALLYIVIQVYKVPKDAKVIVNEETKDQPKEMENNELSMFQFVLKYKKFMLFLLGIVCVYFAHTIINNFFIQVISAVGGSNSDMGNAVFLAAIVELPAMFYFTRLNKKFNCGTLIKFSMIFFVIKHTLTYLAPNVPMMFLAQAMQIGAFALFIPASVYYVNKKVDASDMIKGQSLMTASMTLSGVFASFLGGILLDSIGVNQVLLMGVVLSVIGFVIVALSVEKV